MHNYLHDASSMAAVAAENEINSGALGQLLNVKQFNIRVSETCCKSKSDKEISTWVADGQ